MSKFNKIYIVTDGASRSNPGPSAIGYGLYDPGWNVIEEKAEYIGRATNNEAEYRALIKAVGRAAEYCTDEILHYSDSELLIRQLKGHYRVKAKNLIPLFDTVMKLGKKFKSMTHVHVPRTNKHVQKIDGLVNDALDRAGH